MNAGPMLLVGPLGGLLVLLMVLTGVGGARRGAGTPLAVIGGLFFPVTWAVWYLHDERRLAQGR